MSTRMCECCTGVRTVTPVPLDNRPGLPAVAARVGTHGQFLRSMLARLSSRDHPALATLSTREPGDPAVALLDCFAVIADVLTFYQERIANEGYLRTATEPESLSQLGRLVGYQPRPALGASGHLAFTMHPGMATTIPAGTPAKSVPPTGELPQTFETAEPIEAREEWNALAVRDGRPPDINSGNVTELSDVELAGVLPALRAGDRMLFAFDIDTEPAVLTVHGARVEPERDRTVVSFTSADPAAVYRAALARLRERVDDAMQHAAHHPLAVRALTELAGIAVGLEPTTGPDALIDLLSRHLPRLTEIRAVAVARCVGEVVDWQQPYGSLGLALAAADDAHEAAVAAARTDGLAARGRRQIADRFCCKASDPVSRQVLGTTASDGDGGDCGNPHALLGLAAMLPALAKPPSVPPVRARYLAPDVTDLFATESDVHPRLLAAAMPRAADTLYQAWRNANLTPPPKLSGISVMRVKARPFGATAQAKTDPDGVGWPFDALGAKEDVTVDVAYSAGSPVQVAVTYNRAKAAMRLAPDMPYQKVPLKGDDRQTGAVEVGIDEGTREYVLHLVDGLPDRIFRISSSAYSVSVSDGRQSVVFVLPPDEPLPQDLGADTISVKRSQGEGDRATVTITDTVRPGGYILPLDAVYSDVVPGNHVVVERVGRPTLVTTVRSVAEVTMQRGDVVAPVTRLTLADPWLFAADVPPTRADPRLLRAIRETTVHTGATPVALADEPVADDVGGREIELARAYDGLSPGRLLVVAGERRDVPGTSGVPGTELVMLAGVRQTVDPGLPGDRVHTTLLLANELAYTYRRDTVKIHANVVEATQGESRTEPLGSGDATTANQWFDLRSAPVTALPAVNPLGAERALEVRVGGVRWPEADSLIWLGPADRRHDTQTTGDGRTRVRFGDGTYGARLPTGVENVAAQYRVGAGRSGNVAAGKINQLAAQPPGVASVVNPLPATGGTDADGPDDARATTPLRVLALDRLVSVPDYEDFTRARAGIGKASARRLFDGDREVVHVTIAAADDAPVDPWSRLLGTLADSLSAFGDPHLPVRVGVRERTLIVIAAGVKVMPDHTWDRVEPRVRDAVVARLGFASRELGRSAYLSEAVAAMQGVEGVDYVDVDVFAGISGDLGAAELATVVASLTEAAACVPAQLARFVEQRHTVRGSDTLTIVAQRYGLTVAELLALNPTLTGVDLTTGDTLVVRRGIRPAQLVVLDPAIPETLTLRRIP